MKIKLVLLLLGFTIAQSTVAQNDLIRQRLKGRVKSVTQCQCPVKKNGKIDSIACVIYVFKYNNKGNQMEDNDYLGGNLYSGYGELNHKRLYKYDERDRQVVVDEYDSKGKLSQIVKYKYDEKGNRVERANYKPDGKLWSRSVFGYDEKGNKTECSKYDAASNLQELYSYTYDANGNMLMEQHTKVEAKKGNDDAKKEYMNEVNAERMLDYMKLYSYDDNGTLIGELNHVKGIMMPFQTDFVYENYDNVGNWLKQSNVEHGKPSSIAERVIEYY